MADDRSKSKILLAVSHSTLNGYPNPSISSRQAFEFTLNNIVRSDTSRFKIFILHVYRGQDVFKQLLDKGVPLVSYFDKICREAGIASEGWVREGVRVEEAICDEAQRLRPHLLVLGCRNLSGLQKRFTRSVSDHCAATASAECPVLVVKRKLEDTPVTSGPDD